MATIKVKKKKKAPQKGAQRERKSQALRNLVVDAYRVAREAKTLSASSSAARDEILKSLDDLGIDTIEAEYEESVVKATAVTPESSVIDDAGLIEALPLKIRKKVTRLFLDHKMLEEAVNRGDVSPDLIKEFTNVSKGKTHIRMTERKAKR